MANLIENVPLVLILALTLRLIGGLKTEEIARAYLVSHESMAQRLVRARHKITKAGIP